MPYRKSYKKKRYTKKRTYFDTARDTMSVAGKALTVAYGIKRLMNVEFKFIDKTDTNVTMDDGSGTHINVTNLAQGDTDITRDGNSIKVTSWLFRANITMNPMAVLTFATVLLVQDKQSNGAVYSVSKLLKSVASGLSTISPLNIDNKFRFRVIKRWEVAMSASGKTDYILKFVKKMNMHIRYGSNNGDITDLQSNALSIVIISNEALNAPTITYYNRIRYVDN